MTDIDIINIALSDCGTKLISALNASTPEERVAGAKYAAVRDAVLEDREWTFAKSRLLLAKDAAAPVFGYSFQFIIPSNVIRVVRVYSGSDVSFGQTDDWMREGYRILTNDDAPIYAEVLLRVSENSFSPGMVLALAARLTSVFAIPLTENRQLAKDYMDNYKALIQDAAAMDGSQGRTQRLTPPPMPGRRHLP